MQQVSGNVQRPTLNVQHSIRAVGCAVLSGFVFKALDGCAEDSAHYSRKHLSLLWFRLCFDLMPKPIARSKTRKAVAKRFKITARGKVLRAHSSRRHLMAAKSAKRKRRLSKAALVDRTDVARIKANLPFG
jgi:large subunit ribosomal protein L35